MMWILLFLFLGECVHSPKNKTVSESPKLSPNMPVDTTGSVSTTHKLPLFIPEQWTDNEKWIASMKVNAQGRPYDAMYYGVSSTIPPAQSNIRLQNIPSQLIECKNTILEVESLLSDSFPIIHLYNLEIFDSVVAPSSVHFRKIWKSHSWFWMARLFISQQIDSYLVRCDQNVTVNGEDWHTSNLYLVNTNREQYLSSIKLAVCAQWGNMASPHMKTYRLATNLFIVQSSSSSMDEEIGYFTVFQVGDSGEIRILTAPDQIQ